MTFSKKEALQFGWGTTKKHFWFFAKIILALFLLFGVASAISDTMRPETPLISFSIDIVIMILGIIAGIGIIKISLKFVDGFVGEWEDLYSHAHLFWNYVLGSLILGLIVLCGLILFIVPGILWAIKFGLFKFFIVDKNLGALDALKWSGRITRGAKWNLFSFYILIGIINLLGIIPFGLGLFFTIPTTMVATAYVYRKLLARAEIKQGDAPPSNF